ncbi:MAG: hypothetical protein Q8S73_34215 [Deltaproteobacteria bacterium]|nr:hypothetical protein [Deltaproteobacteria bacterium]
MTNLERAMHKRDDHFPPFAPYQHTARCGRVLRSPEPLPAKPIEPDANTGDRIVATVCAIGIVVLLVLLIVEKVAT